MFIYSLPERAQDEDEDDDDEENEDQDFEPG